MTEFGTRQPPLALRQRIDRCRRLPANWLGKQWAQFQRKGILKQLDLPVDLTLDNIHMRCHLIDNVSERNFAFMPWRFDAIERAVMAQLLPANGVFIDIGANVGIYALLATTQLNQSGVVLAFEPNPEVFKRLQFNMQATLADQASPPRVELLPIGISDECGQFELHLDGDNLGASSLHAKGRGQCLQINCEPLLDVVQAQKLSRIDVIKCDIEGAEDRALAPFLMDAPNYLLPHVFIFENNADQWQNELLETLKQRGYQQTHQTRLNLIFQHKQPVAFAKSRKKGFQGSALIT